MLQMDMRTIETCGRIRNIEEVEEVSGRSEFLVIVGILSTHNNKTVRNITTAGEVGTTRQNNTA